MRISPIRIVQILEILSNPDVKASNKGAVVEVTLEALTHDQGREQAVSFLKRCPRDIPNVGEALAKLARVNEQREHARRIEIIRADLVFFIRSFNIGCEFGFEEFEFHGFKDRKNLAEARASYLSLLGVRLPEKGKYDEWEGLMKKISNGEFDQIIKSKLDEYEVLHSKYFNIE